MPEPTLYLFDGYNLLHAGGYEDPRELIDQLASFVARAGARGIVVFDGHGANTAIGKLEIRYAEDADTLLERLSAEHRDTEEVHLVSSDAAVRGTSGSAVRKVASKDFVRELGDAGSQEYAPHRLSERIDPKVREQLEKLRRGQEP
jgi:predicted RNA-binding protein with PIN domain